MLRVEARAHLLLRVEARTSPVIGRKRPGLHLLQGVEARTPPVTGSTGQNPICRRVEARMPHVAGTRGLDPTYYWEWRPGFHLLQKVEARSLHLLQGAEVRTPVGWTPPNAGST